MFLLMGCVSNQTQLSNQLNPPQIVNTALPTATLRPQPTLTQIVAPVMSPQAPTPAAKTFDGERAYQWVVNQVALGPRITGTAPHRKLGDQIVTTLSASGWTTRTQDFIYKNTPARNLVGIKGAQYKDIVIIGAHYDTRRRADQDAAHPEQPVPGANDGASGVAVLLELARVLDIDQINKQVWLVFFDAEDNGDLDGWEWIVGSQQFANSLTISPTAVIVVDMIGDADQDIWLERSSNQPLASELWDVAARLGYGQYFRKMPRWSMTDDHTPFLNRGWPAVDIIDFDYAHWHKTSDTPDKVSPQSLLHVGRTLEMWLKK